MILEPLQYGNFLPILDRVFAQGVSLYVHPSGFDASRVITGVDVSKEKIEPFWTPANPQRGNASGNNRLFTTDKRPFAFQESLNHTGEGAIPPNTFEIKFRFVGNTLNLERIVDPEFRTLYFKNDATKEENHIFSQCMDYYLEKNGYSNFYDTYGWLSVAGREFPFSGYVHAWKSADTGTLRHVATIKLG